MAFDLRKFAPPRKSRVILANGSEWVFPGEPYADDVSRILRIENELFESDGLDLATAIEEGMAMMRELAAQADSSQPVAEMKMGASEMTTLFTMMMRGESVAQAVMEALNATPAADGNPAADGGDTAAGAVGEGGADPLDSTPPSESSSPEPSFASAADEAGLLATG